MENPGRKIHVEHFALAHARELVGVDESALQRLLAELRVDAAAVVGDLDVDLSALVEGARMKRRLAGLPAAMRFSGDSTPWSTALRTTWVSGSLMASMMVLSRARSRGPPSRRGPACRRRRDVADDARNLDQMLPMGCMRVFMTPLLQLGGDEVERCDVATKLESSGVE